MSENVEEPPEKRKPLAQLESEDLDCLLDAFQAQSTNVTQHTPYLFTKVKDFDFTSEK